MVKPQNLTEEDWDVCIVLDACRFDVFEEMYSDYLEGELEKRKSPGSNTQEWLPKVFGEQYDWLYVSGNSFINSEDLPIKRCKGKSNSEWTATEHFSKILDAWDYGWDELLGTVDPASINRTYQRIDTSGFDRTILHYIQPHAPYTGHLLGKSRRVGQKSAEGQVTKETALNSIRDTVGGIVDSILYRTLGEKSVLYLRKVVSMNHNLTPMAKAVLELGPDRLPELYRRNLRDALAEVRRLLNQEELEGKRVVITSDHGEALGQNGNRGHPMGSDLDILREVPWFKVEGTVEPELGIGKRESDIQGRLEALGYM